MNNSFHTAPRGSFFVETINLFEDGKRVELQGLEGWFLKKENGRMARIEYYHPVSKKLCRVSLGTRDYNTAVERAKEHHKEVLLQKYIGVKGAKSFVQIADEYVKTYTTKKYNIETVHRHLIPFFTKVLGDSKKSQNFHLLETDDMRKYQNWRREVGKVSENTISRESCVLSNIITMAKEKRYLSNETKLNVPTVSIYYNARNPFKGKELNEIIEKACSNWKNEKHPTVKENRRVLYHYILFLFQSGVRCGDALKLTWRNIFLNKQFPFYTISSAKCKTRVNKQIPLEWEAVEMLCNMKQYQKEFCEANNIKFSEDFSVFGLCRTYSLKTIEKYIKYGKEKPQPNIETLKSFKNLLKI